MLTHYCAHSLTVLTPTSTVGARGTGTGAEFTHDGERILFTHDGVGILFTHDGERPVEPRRAADADTLAQRRELENSLEDLRLASAEQPLRPPG